MYKSITFFTATHTEKHAKEAQAGGQQVRGATKRFPLYAPNGRHNSVQPTRALGCFFDTPADGGTVRTSLWRHRNRLWRSWERSKPTASRTSTKKRRSLHESGSQKLIEHATAVSKKGFSYEICISDAKKTTWFPTLRRKKKDAMSRTCAPFLQHVTLSCSSRARRGLLRLSRSRAQFMGDACAVHVFHPCYFFAHFNSLCRVMPLIARRLTSSTKSWLK